MKIFYGTRNFGPRQWNWLFVFIHSGLDVFLRHRWWLMNEIFYIALFSNQDAPSTGGYNAPLSLCLKSNLSESQTYPYVGDVSRTYLLLQNTPLWWD